MPTATEPGVIALDPTRLAQLRSRLDQAASRALGWSTDVETILAGVGWSAAGAVEDLGELSSWAAGARDDVAGRIRMIEQIGGLPLPPLVFSSDAERTAWAGYQARRVQALLDDPAASWDEWQAALDDLLRAEGDAAVVELLALLGGDAASRVSAAVEAAYRRYAQEWIYERPWSPERPIEATVWPDLDVLSRLQVGYAAMVARATRVRGPNALGLDWAMDFAGLDPATDGPVDDPDAAAGVEEITEQLTLAGYGLEFATAVARAVGLGRISFALDLADRVIGFVRFGMGTEEPVDLSIEPEEMLATVFEGAATVSFWIARGSGNPILVVTAVAAGGVFLVVSALLNAAADGDDRPAAGPTYNPGTGQTRPPSGGVGGGGRVDPGGVPYPPNYVR